MAEKSEVLSTRLRSELAQLRSLGRIPTQVRLDQETWNLLRRELTFDQFGARRSVLFDGLPCVLAVGMQRPFSVRSIEARPD